MAENTEYPTADHVEAGVEPADTLDEKAESKPESEPEDEETVPG